MQQIKKTAIEMRYSVCVSQELSVRICWKRHVLIYRVWISYCVFITKIKKNKKTDHILATLQIEFINYNSNHRQRSETQD